VASAFFIQATIEAEVRTVYLAMKTLHVLAVVLFLGNIITGIFWKVHGDRTADPRIIAHTLEGIIRSDRWFTIPGVVLILGFGVGAAVIGGFPILGTGWIWQSIALFAVSGLAFMLQVAPLQRRLQALASVGVGGGPWDEVAYRRLSRRWELWGVVALVTPLAALVLMVYKPSP
jgi:uncharacterized membrane protein